MKKSLLVLLMISFPLAHANHEPWVNIEYPQDKNKWWWDDAWWDDGKIPQVKTYEVSSSEISFSNGDTEINATVFRPKAKGKFPAVLFQHGRRGIDPLTIRHPKRLAARGFVVLVPNIWDARFIEKYPIAHYEETELDTAVAIDQVFKLPEISNKNKTCVVSHTRGGYLTLMALTKHKRMDKVACYISYYPHWQDPNAPEAEQVYRYASEVNELDIPVLVFIGEHDQYQRVREVTQGIEALLEKKRDAKLIVYPGVGRGFDFRPPNVRTFADDLAAKDAMLRSADFINQHLPK